jgi:hypothetical protein
MDRESQDIVLLSIALTVGKSLETLFRMSFVSLDIIVKLLRLFSILGEISV